MFAPKIAKAQSNSGVASAALAASRHSAKRAPGPRAGTPATGAREAEPRASWNFSKLPVFPPALPRVIQAKLVANEPGDEYEQEADRVADQVMRMPAGSLPRQAFATTGVQRQCACGGTCSKCREEQTGHAQPIVTRTTVAGVASPGMAAPPTVHRVLRTPGQALDGATRAFMEPRFGRDFSNVQVHAGADAAASARAVGARAFAVGRHIVLGEGEGAFETHGGRRLLAHELAHVVQQEGSLPQADAGASLANSLLLRYPLQEFIPRRLSADQLVARSKEIFREAASKYLKSEGKAVTETALRRLRGLFTVGVLQGVKDGQIVTLVGANDPVLEPFLKETIGPGERLVESVSLTSHNARTGLPNKTGHAHAHAEPPLSQQAEVEGLTDSLLGSSNKGCVDCVAQMKELSPHVTHVDPKVASRGSVTPSGSIARPVTTTEVASDPAQRYRAGRTPPRDMGKSATISGEIDALEGGSATIAGDVAETSSVIIDDAAILAGKSGRFAALRVVVGELVVGLEVVAVIDTLKMLFELGHDWLTYEKNTEASPELQVAILLQKNEPAIQAALKAHASEAEQITQRQPGLKVYANIAVVIEETWKTKPIWDRDPSDYKLNDITFKDLAISIYPVWNEKVVRETKTETSLAVVQGFTRHARYTLRTFPVEINFGETPQQRQERTFRHDIPEAANKHQSARFAGSSHFGDAPIKADDAEERRRRKLGEPSRQERQDREGRLQYVRLYIEYTALHGPDDLYMDAIAYLKELEAEAAR